MNPNAAAPPRSPKKITDLDNEKGSLVWTPDSKALLYTAADKKVVIEKLEFSGAGFLERMHRRRGFQHNYLLEDLWAVSVDLTIAALLLLSFSGLWMWWELRVTRPLGAIALGTGIALFAIFLSVL